MSRLAASVKYCGSEFPSSVPKCSWKVSLYLLFLGECMAIQYGWAVLYEVAQYRSPKSVSITSIPFLLDIHSDDILP